MNKICFGCGIKLQSDDPKKDGYVPLEVKDKSDYCQRCFRLKHYGESIKTNKPKTTEDIIKTVNKNAKYVVFMVDFIDIFDEVMNIFARIKVPKILVVSKSDIIPKNISFEQLKSYLRTIYKIKDEIVFTSKNSNLNTLIKKLYDKDEIYFLGLTNSGKSTLINSIIEDSGSKMSKLTTSHFENTTQDFVRIEIKGKTLVDSPGFVIDNFELDKLSNMTSTINPITYQNKVDCTYDIGNKLKIKIKGTTNAVLYFSKNLEIKRSYNKELPGTTFKVDANRDIVICGLGFIKITDGVEITIPNNIMKYINIRPSITGGIYE